MIHLSKEVRDYRYERKFHVPELRVDELNHILKLHPALFSEIFYRRAVNNIYFDTTNFDFYQENLAGVADRVKVRIRWYGDIFGHIKKPKLELKIKKGFLGTKVSYPLVAFDFDKNMTLKKMRKEVFLKSDLPPDVAELLKPVHFALVNRYMRKYYVSSNKGFRATVDDELEFYRIKPCINTFQQKCIRDEDIVLEIKYNFDYDDQAHKVCNQFPFRVTKFSKYVTGIAHFEDHFL